MIKKEEELRGILKKKHKIILFFCLIRFFSIPLLKKYNIRLVCHLTNISNSIVRLRAKR